MTIKNFALIAFAGAVLAACNLSVDPSTRKEVTIEGVPHYVWNARGMSNSYISHEKNLMGGLIDSNDYRQNVMAIEAVTGCTVDSRTIINSGLQTRALVTC
jgi:hypothetical protein